MGFTKANKLFSDNHKTKISLQQGSKVTRDTHKRKSKFFHNKPAATATEQFETNYFLFVAWLGLEVKLDICAFGVTLECCVGGRAAADGFQGEDTWIILLFSIFFWSRQIGKKPKKDKRGIGIQLCCTICDWKIHVKIRWKLF